MCRSGGSGALRKLRSLHGKVTGQRGFNLEVFLHCRGDKFFVPLKDMIIQIFLNLGARLKLAGGIIGKYVCRI